MSTYTPIQTITLSSTASSVEFVGIPQIYTDLILTSSSTHSSGDSYTYMQVGNNSADTAANYSQTSASGDGTSATSGRLSSQNFIYLDWYARLNATNPNLKTVNFMSYSNQSVNKSILIRNGSTNKGAEAQAALWRSNSAINYIKLYIPSGNFTSGSTFTLHGVVPGNAKAIGGNTIISDGTYWYHTFLSSGILQPMENLTCEALVIAGGGGAGNGGGGAGGYRSGTGISLTNGSPYVVTVGAGGPANTSVSAQITKGVNSSFSTITSSGGGSSNPSIASIRNGGSGAGGEGYGGTPGTGNLGGYTPSEGNGGGVSGSTSSGGGGGAGATGGNGSGATGGNGGSGSNAHSTWATVTKTGVSGYYAGGGGGSAGSTNATGGSGGAGGGGGGEGIPPSGVPNTVSVAGTQNTGGGGGAGWSALGKPGGSGIVIVRYPV